MEQIIADVEALVQKMEQMVTELEAAGKAEAALLWKLLVAQFNAVLAEIRKVTGV